MKCISALIFCPVAVLSAAIARETQLAPSGPFAAGAWKIPQGTDPPFFGTAINASGGKFYINRATSTYCPAGVSGLDCSAFSGSGTTLIIGESSVTMSLEVTVPGGQQGKFSNHVHTPQPQPH
jgi:hypothetical protein